MGRRNFRAEFEKLERECADACVAIFKHYGITKLKFRSTTTTISNDDGKTPYFIKAIVLANPDAEINYCEEYFDILDYNDRWWTDGCFELDWIDLYDCINDAIDDNLNNNIPISEWGKGVDDSEEDEDYDDDYEDNEYDEPNPQQLGVLSVFKRMENAYWLFANNALETIFLEVPDFSRDNPDAIPSIVSWEKFKKRPCESTFNFFIDTFKYYGSNPLMICNSEEPMVEDENECAETEDNSDSENLNPKQRGISIALKYIENQYWCIANDILVMLFEVVPDFSYENREAASIIDLWYAFKNNPCKKEFDAFIAKLRTYSSAIESSNSMM